MDTFVRLTNEKFEEIQFDNDLVLLKTPAHVTYGDYKQALYSSGLERGDTIVLHSELMNLGRIGNIGSREEFADVFIKGIIDVIGNEGCLLIPAFTYSYCNKEDFFPLKVNATVGLIPNRILQWNGVCRSTHPIFSYAGIGSKATDYLCADHYTSFSKGSTHWKFFEKNVKFCFIGKQGLQMCTSVHTMERHVGVNSRYPKIFEGRTIINKKIFNQMVEYYVRDLDINPIPDFSKLKANLFSEKLVRETRLGMSFVTCYMASDIWNLAVDGLEKDDYFLVRVNSNK